MKYQNFIENHGFTGKVKMTKLENDENFCDLVLIEGDQKALNFLADLIKSFANDDTMDKVHMGPDTAGNAYFAVGSELGFYLHKI